MLIGERFTYGATVHYTCNGDHSLVGNSTRVCQEDSHWSGALPHCTGEACCQHSCPSLPSPVARDACPCLSWLKCPDWYCIVLCFLSVPPHFVLIGIHFSALALLDMAVYSLRSHLPPGPAHLLSPATAHPCSCFPCHYPLQPSRNNHVFAYAAARSLTFTLTMAVQ